MTIKVESPCLLYLEENLNKPPRELQPGQNLQPYHKGYLVPIPDDFIGSALYVVPLANRQGGSCQEIYVSQTDSKLEPTEKSSRGIRIKLDQSFTSNGRIKITGT